MTKISVVGLGKLGQPFAVCLAARGFEVLGIDKDRGVAERLFCGEATVQEPGLQSLLQDVVGDNLWFSHNLALAIEASDVTFILVGTPSEADGSFSNAYLVSVLDELGAALKESDKPRHLFVVGSTVSPGAAAKSLIPTLTRHVERERFGYVYCPELVALGDVVNGFLHPDFVVIGTDDASWPVVRDVYDQMTPGVEIVRLTVAEAEIFKVALNFFLTLKISFANTIANICEHFPGVDVDHVTEALGRDSRISPKFLKGGMAFGGFCFPRDVRAFGALEDLTKSFFSADLASAVRDANTHSDNALLEKIKPCESDKVSVLGLSFKPGTPEIEASPSVELAKILIDSKKAVTVYDPLALDKARDVLGDRVEYAASAKECAAAAPVVVLATAWPEYADLEEGDFQPGATVIDCWRMLKGKLANSERVKYVGIGMGQ